MAMILVKLIKAKVSNPIIFTIQIDAFFPYIMLYCTK
jgi:hypothetical protein